MEETMGMRHEGVVLLPGSGLSWFTAEGNG